MSSFKMSSFKIAALALAVLATYVLKADAACSESPCRANTSCKDNSDGTHECVCDAGFRKISLVACTDENECLFSPCDTNADCTNIPGSYECKCKTGYEGNGETCKDINECANAPSPCDANADCANSQGSYACTCKGGFEGNGVTCSAVPPAGPSACPTWMSGYDNSCYKLVRGKNNWAASAKKCAWLAKKADMTSGDLASISDVAEYNFIVSLMNKGHQTWIGLSDINTEGTFEWSDSSRFGFSKWANLKGKQQPDGGTAQNCVVLNRETKDVAEGQWLDVPCTKKFWSVCKFEYGNK